MRKYLLASLFGHVAFTLVGSLLSIQLLKPPPAFTTMRVDLQSMTLPEPKTPQRTPEPEVPTPEAEETQPSEQALFMNGVWHYARGLAYVHTGDKKKSVTELNAVQAILADPKLADYPVSLNGAAKLLQIAAALLAGEIAAASEDYDGAIALMELAVRLQDGLLYMEPPDWFMPARHYLGAILLEADWPAEAETVYWADLRKNPNNGFALFGLLQAQQAQGKSAKAVQERFKQAWEGADHELSSSRY